MSFPRFYYDDATDSIRLQYSATSIGQGIKYCYGDSKEVIEEDIAALTTAFNSGKQQAFKDLRTLLGIE